MPKAFGNLLYARHRDSQALFFREWVLLVDYFKMRPPAYRLRDHRQLEIHGVAVKRQWRVQPSSKLRFIFPPGHFPDAIRLYEVGLSYLRPDAPNERLGGVNHGDGNPPSQVKRPLIDDALVECEYDPSVEIAIRYRSNCLRNLDAVAHRKRVYFTAQPAAERG